MKKQEQGSKEYYSIDLLHIVRSLWRRAWIIVLAGMIAAAAGFCVAAFAITPTYSSSIMLYVNNGSFQVGDFGFSISSSELTAAQSLAKTYTVLLKNRTTLERLIDETGVDYNWEEIYDMIESGPVNETEVLRVTVTCRNPYEAEKLANGIASVLPKRISEVVEGASMEVVDSAIADTEKVAPSITMYTAVWFIVGVLISAAFLIVLAILDDTIHDEEYVISNYDYPVLAKIPNLLSTGSKYEYKYRYYKKRTSYKN